MPEGSTPPAARGRLFRTYALLINALVGTLLLASAALSLTFSYRESRDHLVALQFEQAQGAAARIEQVIADIEQQLGWTALSGMNAGSDPLAARRIDYLKLLRQVPAITEAAWLDAQGREQLRVSRLTMDAQGQALDRSAEPLFTEPAAGRVYRSPVSFRKQTEPYMTIARRAGPTRDSGVTVVEVNLKFVWDVVARIHPGEAGLAYAVDATGALIAHPDISLVLKQTDLGALPQVAAASRVRPEGEARRPGAPADALPDGVAIDGAQDLAGQPVLSSNARLATLGWTVFVESPRSQAYAPLYANLLRLGLLLAAGLLISIAASAWLARTLVRPIRQLQDGAARVAAGDLDHRLAVHTRDELEDLAGEFNRMAGELKASYESLERKVRERTAELAEALARQTATAEVLQVIGRSVADAGPVFAKILESCEQLIPDTVASLLDLVDGDRIVLADFRMRVTDNTSAEVRAARDRRVRAGYPHPLRGSATEAALHAGRVVEFTDTLNGPDTPPQTREFAISAGYPFSLMVAPMRWEGRPIGSIGLIRYTLVPFGPKERELLQTFADQAAIAIQNARLFTETREALEQRTATTEVLQAISRSVADPQPVFEKIIDHCEHLFGSDQPGIFLVDDAGQLRVGAFRGPDRARVLASYPKPLEDTLSAVAIRARRPVELADVLADATTPAYLRTLAEQTGNFAVMVAPLIHGERAIGSIVVTRRPPRPFLAKERTLLDAFADQAVIAIENARLFNDTQEALARQTATAEVLQVISSSVSDTAPVFDKILDSCQHLFATDQLAIFFVRPDGQVHIGAFRGSLMAGARESFPRPLDETTTGLAIRQRRPVIIASALGPDVQAATRAFAARAGDHSAVNAPMLWEGTGIGSIVALRQPPRPFTAQEAALLATFADQAVIAIRNAQLVQEIRNKSDQLEVASRHKSEFLANMSHELRTPLNAIIGFSEVLAEQMFGQVNQRQLEYLNDIHASGHHLLQLINDILDLAKIEAGRMELELAPCDLAQVLESAIGLIRERAARQGLRLHCELAPGLGSWTADARKLKQAVLNLLSNAVKFTPEGGQVTLRARLAGDGDARVAEIAVIDTGVGIAPAEQALVFEEFRQVGTDPLRKAEGTGLGLALVRRFVELHGGTVRLDSALGQGATFVITLPERGLPAALAAAAAPPSG